MSNFIDYCTKIKRSAMSCRLTWLTAYKGPSYEDSVKIELIKYWEVAVVQFFCCGSLGYTTDYDYKLYRIKMKLGMNFHKNILILIIILNHGTTLFRTVLFSYLFQLLKSPICPTHHIKLSNLKNAIFTKEQNFV